jgi:hypothetical protein
VVPRRQDEAASSKRQDEDDPLASFYDERPQPQVAGTTVPKFVKPPSRNGIGNDFSNAESTDTDKEGQTTSNEVDDTEDVVPQGFGAKFFLEESVKHGAELAQISAEVQWIYTTRENSSIAHAHFICRKDGTAIPKTGYPYTFTGQGSDQEEAEAAAAKRALAKGKSLLPALRQLKIESLTDEQLFFLHWCEFREGMAGGTNETMPMSTEDGSDAPESPSSHAPVKTSVVLKAKVPAESMVETSQKVPHSDKFAPAPKLHNAVQPVVHPPMKKPRLIAPQSKASVELADEKNSPSVVAPPQKPVASWMNFAHIRNTTRFPRVSFSDRKAGRGSF